MESDGTVAVVRVVASRVDSECYDLAMARLALHSGGESRTALEELVEEVFGKPS
jgi:mRNA interferase RelE/StbE